MPVRFTSDIETDIVELVFFIFMKLEGVHAY